MFKDAIKVKVIKEVAAKLLSEPKFHELNIGSVYDAKLEYWMDGVPAAYCITGEDGFKFEIGYCDIDGNVELEEEYELV